MNKLTNWLEWANFNSVQINICWLMALASYLFGSCLSYCFQFLFIHSPLSFLPLLSTLLFVLIVAKFFLPGKIFLLLPHSLPVFNIQETLLISFKTNFSYTTVWHPLEQWSVRSSLDSRNKSRQNKSRQNHHSSNHPQRTQRKISVGPCLLLEVINCRGKSYILSGAHFDFCLSSHILSNFANWYCSSRKWGLIYVEYRAIYHPKKF